MLLLLDMFPYIVSAGGAVAWITAYKSRKAAKRKVEIEIDAQWQDIYRGIITDLRIEVGQLKEEVKMMRAVVESYKATCDACPHKQNSL